MSRLPSQPSRKPLALAIHATLLGLGLTSATFSSTTLAQTTSASSTVARSYDQAAAPLADALKQLAQSTGINIQFNNEQLAGRSAPALRGNYTPAQALSALLAGSGLSAQTSAGGYVIVSQANPSSQSLPETVIRARADNARDNEGSTAVVSDDDLNKRNVATMADVVRYQPLVNAPSAASGQGNVWDGSGNNGYNIRGVEGNRVSLDVDGVPLPAAAPKPDGSVMNSFGIGRDYIDTEMFREIDINSGTTFAGRRSGQGLGGGVSFVTKSPEDYLIEGKPYALGYKSGYYGANSSTSHTATLAGQTGDVQALLVYTRRDGDETENFDNNPPANKDDWNSNALLAKVNWRLNSSNRLSFSLDHYERKNERTIDSRVSTSYPEGATQHGKTERDTYSIAHSYTPSNFGLFDSLTTRAYYQDASIVDRTLADYFTGGTAYYRDIQTGFYNKDTGLTADAEKRFGASSKLRYGLGYNLNDSRRPWSEVRYNATTGAQVSGSTGSKNRMADSDFQTLTAYAQYDYGFQIGNLKSTLTPVLRVERVTFKPKNINEYVVGVPAVKDELKKDTSTALLPSLQWSVALAPQFDAYAQYKRGVRVPKPVEKTGTYDSFSYTGGTAGYAVLGNPDLDKETSDAFELGVKGLAARGVNLSASVFYTRYRDFIEYTAQETDPNYPTISYGLYRPENIGRATIKGAEFSSRFDLGTWSNSLLGFSTTIAAGVARGTATNTETGTSGKLPSVAPAKASLIFAYDAPSERFGVSAAVVHAVSKQADPDVIAGQGSSTAARFKVPSYTVLDLYAYWNISKNASINLGIYNVTDKKYWDYASVRGEAATATSTINRQSQPGRNASVSVSLKF